jgi:hypothetical protein
MEYIIIFESFKEFPFLRKEPKYLDLFKKLTRDSDLSIEDTENLYNRIKTHRNTIKQNNLEKDILKAVNTEQIQDILQEIELIEKFNKYTKLLPSGLRKSIRNDEILKDKFKNHVMNLEYEDYKGFLSKVSKYKTIGEFFKAIENHISKNSVEKINLINRIKEHPDTDIWYIDEQYVIALIYSERASCEFGSQQWCISSDLYNHWDKYVGKIKDYGHKIGIQYFLWDFSLDPSDKNSQIGITYYDTQSITAHDKRDGRYKVPVNVVDKLVTWTNLPEDKKIKYMAHNKSLLNNSEIKKLSTEYKKKILSYNAYKTIPYFDDFEFLTKEEIEKILNNNPDAIAYSALRKRLDDEFIKELIINNPHIHGKFNSAYLRQIFNNDLYPLYKSVCEKIDYTDDWKNDYDYLINKIDENIIENLLEDNYHKVIYLFLEKIIDVDTADLIRIYENNKEVFNKGIEDGKKILTKKSGYPYLNILEKFFSDEKLYLRYIDQNIYVFNARYVKKKIGENNRGKDIFEEELEIENMIKLNILKNSNIVNMMKVRANMQGDLKTYKIWINKDLLNEDQISQQELIEKYGQAMITSIEEKMDRI